MSNPSALPRIRRLPVGLLALFASGAFAQSPPKNLEALPDIPAPPKLSNTQSPDDGDGTQVTIRQDGENKVEEFRTAGGRVYAIRVTPKVGKPYLLVDPDGKGTMTNATEINGGVKPAQWTIFEF